MSEEEKKAIERIDYIQDFIIENGQYNADVNDMQYFSKVLNVIKKQSKEIEELKTEKAKRSMVHIKENGEVEPLFYVSKAKIKAKIEEVVIELENYEVDKINVFSGQTYMEKFKLLGKLYILKELLEE